MKNNRSTKTDHIETLEALVSEASSIHVGNTESDSSRFFHMNVPFQITLECCGVPTSENYVNVVTLSADKALLYQESASAKNFAPPHFHDFFEFVIVLEGSIVQKIEGKDYLYSAGSCCLINRSLFHTEHYNASARALFIGLSPAFLQELFDAGQTSSFQSERKICDGEIYRFIAGDLKRPGEKAYLDFIPSCQNHRHAAKLHALAESMVHTLLYPDFGASYQIRGLLCAFLSYLSSPQNYHCTNVKLDTGSDFLIFSRIKHLLEESDGRMSRAELEQRLHYSGDYLNRLVNRYSGMCIFDYGMTFCLKKAAMYLTQTNESVESIAAKLQFSNRTHFYHLFREMYGMTPKEYRKTHV